MLLLYNYSRYNITNFSQHKALNIQKNCGKYDHNFSSGSWQQCGTSAPFYCHLLQHHKLGPLTYSSSKFLNFLQWRGLCAPIRLRTKLAVAIGRASHTKCTPQCGRWGPRITGRLLIYGMENSENKVLEDLPD